MRILVTTKDDPASYVTADIPRTEAPDVIAWQGHVYVIDPGYNVLAPLDGAEARYFRASVYVASGATTLFEGDA